MPVVLKKKPVETAESIYAKHLDGPKMGIKAAEAVAHVSITKKTGEHGHGKEVSTSEVVHKGVTTTMQPALINVTGARTINLGNYNSVKIGVSLTMPSNTDDQSLMDTYEFASNWVSERIEAAVNNKENG